MKTRMALLIGAAMVVSLWGSPGLLEALEVTVSDALARPGERAVVSIEVDDATGIAGGDIELSYDPIALTVLGVEKTALTSDLLLVSNLKTPGLVKISFAGTAGLEGGSGSIADIRFVVNGGAEGVSPLRLLYMELRDAETQLIPIGEIVQGVVTVEGVGRNREATTSLDLDPAPGDQGITSKVVALGDSIDVFLYVQDASHIGGYMAVVRFDPGVVAYVSGGIETAEERNVLQSGGGVARALPPLRCEDTVILVNAALNPTLSTTPGGSGFLGRLRFRVLDSFARGQQTSFTGTTVLMGRQAAEVDILEQTTAKITIEKQGDFNGNGRVGMGDFELFAEAFGTTSEDPEFEPLFDLNGDGRVWFEDFFLFTAAFEGSQAKLAAAASARGIPVAYRLAQNAPNPFNAETVIRYTVPVPGAVALSIYATSGQRIRMLVDDDRPAGNHAVAWDGLDDRGEPVASGTYVYALQAGGLSQVRKMVLIR